MQQAITQGEDLRTDQRYDVFYRTRVTDAAGTRVALVVVNISAGGLMARCEGAFQPGDRLVLVLPVVGCIPARIRWALSGRVGCRFDAAILPEDLAAVMAAMAPVAA